VPAEVTSGEIDGLTAIEFFSAVTHATAGAYIWDNSHFQYEQGFLPLDHWQRVRETIKASVRNDPITRFMLRTNRVQMRVAFQAEIDKILTEIESESSSE
jgi:hypothetical protein